MNILYDALITGYFVFENNLVNTCASTTIFPKSITVALALWASIFYADKIVVSFLSEPPHDKTNKMACAPIEDSDQTGRLRCPHEESLGP